MTVRIAGGALAVLLFLEYLALSLSFDVEPLRARGGLSSIIGWVSPAAAAAVVAAAAAFVLVRSPEVVAELDRAWVRPSGFALRSAAHGLCVLALFILTPQLFHQPAMAAVWIVLALTAGGTAVAAAFTWDDVGRIVRPARRPLLVSSAIGVFAVGTAGLSSEALPILVEVTLMASVALLLGAGMEPFAWPEERLLGLGDFVVEVSNECSGIEGVGLAVVFVGAYVVLDRRDLRLPAAWIAIPVAVLLVLVSNVFRIAGLVWIGSQGFEDVAMGGFHSKAGWILFSVVALGTVAMTRRAFGHPTGTRERGAEASTESAAPLLIPLLATIGASMTTGLVAGAAPIGHPVVVLVGAGALVWALRRLPRGTLAPSSWVSSVAYGVLAYAAWMALLAVPDFDAAWLAKTEVADSIVWVGSRLVGSVAVVPVVEELAFRAFLLRRLAGGDPQSATIHRRGAAWAGSSLAFGFLHQDLVGGVVAGAIYGWLYLRSDRLGDAIVAHAVTNGLLAVHVLAQGAWYLWL